MFVVTEMPEVLLPPGPRVVGRWPSRSGIVLIVECDAAESGPLAKEAVRQFYGAAVAPSLAEAERVARHRTDSEEEWPPL